MIFFREYTYKIHIVVLKTFIFTLISQIVAKKRKITTCSTAVDCCCNKLSYVDLEKSTVAISKNQYVFIILD